MILLHCNINTQLIQPKTPKVTISATIHNGAIIDKIFVFNYLPFFPAPANASHTFHTLGMIDFYPAIEPFDTGTLPLDAIHTMYFEQSGNPSGVTVVFLHGDRALAHRPRIGNSLIPRSIES